MKKIITTLVLCAATSSLAMANNAQTPSVDSFDALDMDQDGIISVQEASVSATLTEAFATIDSDADQQLSKEEYKEYMASMVKKSG